MLAFTLSSLKDATSHLFTQPSFDDFDVLSVTIVSYITFSMDGHLNAAFFEDADTQPDKLCSWQRLRPVCFSIIKGIHALPLHPGSGGALRSGGRSGGGGQSRLRSGLRPDVGGVAPGVRPADRALRLAAPPLIPGEGVPPEKSMPENGAQPRPYAFSGKSVRNAFRGFFCRNEGFPRIFPMECNLLWLKMFGSLFRAGTCCRRAVCISSEKSVSLSEEPAPEGGRLIALGGLLPAGRILPAKR